MGDFYHVMSGICVDSDFRDLPWQAGLYTQSTDPTIFNAHGAFTTAVELFFNGTADPDDGLAKMYSNLTKLQKTQTYDFAPSLGTKGLSLSTVEDIPGTLLGGRPPSALSLLVRLYGAPGVRSVGKMFLPAAATSRIGPFGDVNYQVEANLPASLALLFGSLMTNGYMPALYRRPTHDMVPAAEYSWSRRFWWLESRQPARPELRERTSL